MTDLESRIEKQPYGTSQTGRLTIPEAEEILGAPHKCLDHGFVRLVDYMGGDASIAQAARVSYGAGTKKVSEDEGLIRYLMRHHHTTPFEMVDLKFHAKMPIFVARQWIRHRTASVNEISARYSIIKDEFYIPDPDVVCVQAKNNKQGREEPVTVEQAGLIREIFQKDSDRAYDVYELLLNTAEDGKTPLDPSKPQLAREIARMNLPVNIYTEWYWKANLHNVLHFLGLRMDPHAQHEIRVYANAMADMVKRVAPVSMKAFEDYRLNAMTLSALDIQALQIYSFNKDIDIAASIFPTKRERDEFSKKFDKLFNYQPRE